MKKKIGNCVLLEIPIIFNMILKVIAIKFFNTFFSFTNQCKLEINKEAITLARALNKS